MGNETEPGLSSGNKDSGVAIAVILPSLFAIVIFILIAIAFLLPRFAAEDAAAKEARRKKRLEKLESSHKSQHFVDWAAKQSREHPGQAFTINPLCVICLDEFEDAAQIRGLGCLHVFHQECLDDWFGRWNEYCPLCHRPIIPGMKPKPRRDSGEPPPVAFMV